jgi:hypothetical protein
VPQAPQQDSATRLQTLIQSHFGSLNIADAATLIQDDQFVALQNAMSYSTGNCAVFPGPLLLSAPPTGKSIHNIWCAFVASVAYIMVQMTDGSLYSYDIATDTFASVKTGTTVDGLFFAKFQGGDGLGDPDALLWTDTNLGYGYWDGTTWHTIDATIKGNSIAVYAGRAWIAVGNNIVYTSISGYTDLGDDGGAFTVTDPTMNGPIVKLLASQDWLYIIGSSLMALNNVQVQTVGGSSSTTTTFFITLVASSIGIQTDKAALCYDNTLLLVTDSGIYAYYGLVGQKISAPMGDNFKGSYYLSACHVFGKTVLFIDNGFCFIPEDNRWFNVSYSFSPWLVQDTLIHDGLTGYVATASGLYQFGADTATAQDVYIHTKLYDAGNASIDKQLVKIGMELYQNELVNPANDPAPISISWRADGFITSSAAFSANNIDGTLNQWLRQTVNLKDRYFSIAITLSALPGTSVSAFMFQFQDSTIWP